LRLAKTKNQLRAIVSRRADVRKYLCEYETALARESKDLGVLFAEKTRVVDPDWFNADPDPAF
jgi:hypothetical protein